MILKLQYVVIFQILYSAVGFVKFTNLKCLEYNKSLIQMPLCELKLVQRGTVALNINVTLIELPLNKLMVNLELQKKANGYRPFLYNISGDLCQAMNPNTRINFVGVFLTFLAKSTNINHTCPYNHGILVRNLILRQEMFQRIPLPDGDYLLNVRMVPHKRVWQGCIKAYFTVKM